MNCPRCHSTPLKPHNYENIEIDNCETCKGVWVGIDELTDIIDTRLKKFSKNDIKKTINNSFQGLPELEADKDITCPICQSELSKLNYAVDSGIIIDRCPNDHGFWFDKNELEKVQQSREYWQDNREKNEAALIKILEEKYTEDNPYDNISPSLFSLSAFLGLLFEDDEEI